MKIMTKVPEYPRPHDWTYNFAIAVESASGGRATHCPIITYDEGLGAMSAYESNPVNASFVEASTDHCYPTSRINKVWCKLDVGMSKVMLETDKVHAIRFGVSTVHTSFMDGQLAEDELSTLDLNEIIELQNESTDRQTYPLYGAVDLKDFKSNAGLDMPAETPGLDTDLEIESVAFTVDDYYDCLHYYTNGAKLRTIFEPIRYYTLTRTNPVKTIYFNQFPNTKFMNPYAYLGAFIYLPSNIAQGQYGRPADTTVETSQLEFTFQCRYNEFNHEFNHSML